MKKIIISPDKVLFGETVSIKLTGFDSNQEIKLNAKLKDDNKTYISSATFRANIDGEVDLNKDAPISGSYSGIEPMGLIVYMIEEDTKEKFVYIKKSLDSCITEFSVMVNEKSIITSTLEQYILDDTIIQEDLHENNLQGTLFFPKKQNNTVVICLSGSDGGKPNAMASLFASHGFTSLALAYFHYDSLPKTLSQIPLEYFEKVFEFLKNNPRTKDKKISIVAGSRGAELALLLASKYSFINSVVAYAPSHVLWSGTGDYKQIKSSAWSYNNKELAFVQVKVKFMELMKYLFSKQALEFTSTFLHSLDGQVNKDAIIKVENIKGDILLISGDDDKMWCSTFMATKIMQRLKEHNFQYNYKHLSYEGAGHMITTPYFPAKYKNYYHPVDKKIYNLGGNAYSDLQASKDSWKKVLEFLKT